MWRRAVSVIVTFALGIFAVFLAAATQPRRHIPVIGVLEPGITEQFYTFMQGLRDLGYVVGQTIVLQHRFAGFQLDRLPALAAELVQHHPDVIVTWTTPAVLAAKQATATIPIVVASADDLVQQGIVASLAHPGGNITGMTFSGAELEEKRLQMLKEVVPTLVHVAVLVNPTNAYHARRAGDMERVAQALGVRLLRVEVRSPHDPLDELETAFAPMVHHQVEGLVISNDAVLSRYATTIAARAIQHRLPTVAGWEGFASAGALIAYEENRVEMFRRAAVFVDKILQGNAPAELPVERALTFRLVINLRTAESLGITMPPTLLVLADKVIR
jgi:putative ABC transport system substrate-binding protein